VVVFDVHDSVETDVSLQVGVVAFPNCLLGAPRPRQHLVLQMVEARVLLRLARLGGYDEGKCLHPRIEGEEAAVVAQYAVFDEEIGRKTAMFLSFRLMGCDTPVCSIDSFAFCCFRAFGVSLYLFRRWYSTIIQSRHALPILACLVDERFLGQGLHRDDDDLDGGLRLEAAIRTVQSLGLLACGS
jgi:hypothetical protein